MMMLFICMIIGFTLGKAKILSEDSATTVAKLETWVFCPALSFSSMSRYFTVKTLSSHALNITLAAIFIAIAVTVAVILAKLFVREKCDERGIYTYVLTFGNYGYMGDPLIKEIFGDEMLANYKLFCVPVLILTYAWGISLLIPKGKGKNNTLKSIFNPSTVAMLLGMIVGISGLGTSLPVFMSNTLTSLGNCMGPVAMILLGLTVSSYDIREMLTDKKIYIATLLRLVILPAALIHILFGVKELANLAFNLEISNLILIYAFFIVATPHGMNTIVFPKAYGGNPKTGAGLSLISHTLSIITIPLMFSLMRYIFP